MNYELFYYQLVPVFASRRIADVDPLRHELAINDTGAFVDDLVGVQPSPGAHVSDEVSERVHVVSAYVCGLAAHVLRAYSAADELVELRTAVAAIDVDGLAELAAQGVEDVVHERVEVPHGLRIRLVRYSVVLSGVAAAQFVEREVFHIY